MEKGRTLTETLAMLAIVGILSVVGMRGYTSAMDKSKANTLLDEAQKRAVIVAGQIGLNGNTPSLAEFSPYNTTAAGTFGEVITTGVSGQFGIQVSGVKKSVCQTLLNAIGENTSIRRLSYEATPRTPLTDCQEDDAFLIVYNNDLQGAKSDTEYATDDSSCKTVCGIFNPDTHLCDESDCDIPEGTCTTDTDCNAENECMVCDTEAGMCKNACERVAYLEATGTQYIRTNIDISQTDHFKATYLVSMTKRSGRAEMGYSADHHGYWGITKENFYALAARPIRLSPKEKDTILFERNIINGEENHKLWVNNSLEKEINLPSPETGIFSIFGIGRNGSYRSVGKIYIFQMTLNGTPVHDSVPVLAPNGKTCLFNKVPDPEDGKSKLYCNAGSGDFKTNKEP